MSVAKKLGDHVKITGGARKGQTGKLVFKEKRGWTVEIAPGETVLVAFPYVELIQDNASMVPVVEDTPATEAAVEVGTVESAQSKAESPSAAETSPTEATTSEAKPDISKMSVKRLQDLAKQKGIGIARTKSDFLRIIAKMHPEEDLTTLKGPALFNRVTELHISRLRSKEDLQNLLSAK